MSGRRVVKGKAPRATCPECGRSTACYLDRAALEAFHEVSYLLQPHNRAPREKCKGWRVYKDALEPRAAVAPTRGDEKTPEATERY